MKKAIVCAVLGIGSLMMAQQTPNRQEAREQKRIENQKANLDKMKQELGLNDAQVAKIKDIRDREFQLRKTKMEQEKTERKARMEKHDSEMKNILSTDQYNKWKANRVEKMERMKNKKMKGHRKMRPEKTI